MRICSHSTTRLVPRSLAALALSACGPGDPPPFARPAPAGVVRWQAAATRLGVPGMAIVVVARDGGSWQLAWGVRNTTTGQPVTPATQFYIASVTKPFLAQTVWHLAEQGALQLDAPVASYLPRFTLDDTALARRVTVRDLLAHRVGIARWPITFGEAYTGQMTDERFYRLLRTTTETGAFQYSNEHYTVLGRVVDAAGGTTWQAALQRTVLDPAGMSRTTTRAGRALADPNHATAYRIADGRLEPARTTKTDRTMHAAGGMYSTLADLASFLVTHLKRGRHRGGQKWRPHTLDSLASLQVQAEEQHPLVSNQRRIGWGLGWELRRLGDELLVVHGGSFEGASAHVSMLPGRGIGVAVLANVGAPGLWLAEAIVAEIYNEVLGLPTAHLVEKVVEIAAASRRDSVPGPAANGRPTRPVDQYVGRYEHPDWGRLELYLSDGELAARIGDLSLPLVWTGPDRFVAGWDHAGRFVISTAGAVTGVELGMPYPDVALFQRTGSSSTSAPPLP